MHGQQPYCSGSHTGARSSSKVTPHTRAKISHVLRSPEYVPAAMFNRVLRERPDISASSSYVRPDRSRQTLKTSLN